MSKEVKNFIESLKNEVTNSIISDKERKDICAYLGRSMSKKQTVEDCQKFLDATQWPGVGDADKLSAWWAICQKEKNNGHPSQLKKGESGKRGRRRSKKQTPATISNLPTEMANSGWVDIRNGLILSGLEQKVFMAKVMKMFSDELDSESYREKETNEIAHVKELQKQVNELSAKIQPTVDEINRLKGEIRTIEKQWEERNKFKNSVGEYTYCLYNNK